MHIFSKKDEQSKAVIIINNNHAIFDKKLKKNTRLGQGFIVGVGDRFNLTFVQLFGLKEIRFCSLFIMQNIYDVHMNTHECTNIKHLITE